MTKSKEEQKQDVIAKKSEALFAKSTRATRLRAVAYFDIPADDWGTDEQMVYLAWLLDTSVDIAKWNDTPLGEIMEAIENS